MHHPGPDFFAGLGCLALAAYRCRPLPGLRPAALALAAWCSLDAARVAGLPAMLDVAVFVAMPACWGALLVRRGDLAAVRARRMGPTRQHVREIEPASHRIDHATAARELGEMVGRSEGAVRAHIVYLPPASALAYAIALLLARNIPSVTSTWTALLQLPRVMVFCAALAVALSRRILPPSRAVGVALGLASGIGVSAGLWASWGGVRALSLTAWIMVAVIIAHARQPDPA